MNYRTLFSIKFSITLIVVILMSQWSIGQINSNHDHSHDDNGKARLAFQCAVCSNHLGFVEPSTEIKGGFALNGHKHALVEVEGLYQCNACKTPIFKAKNELDLPGDSETLYFNRPIDNNRINIVTYDEANLGELKDHCPVCANKFANAETEINMGNFGSRVSFKDLKKVFKKQ